MHSPNSQTRSLKAPSARRRASRLAPLLIALCLWAAPGLARAQLEQFAEEPMALEDARAYVRQFLEGRPRFYPCVPGWGMRRLDSFTLDDEGARFQCSGRIERTLSFEAPLHVWRPEVPGLNNDIYCVSPTEQLCAMNRWTGETQGIFFVVEDEERQRFVNAWAAISAPAPTDPAQDTRFVESVLRARADPRDRGEDIRRVQLQAETLVEAGRVSDAAAAYSAALEEMPHWALGQYNYALVTADLHDYETAIRAMRRYLYLEPNAPDARAVQDQIYRWEALGGAE